MRRRILLIEDHADLREAIGELLEINGYEVLTAADGLEGLTIAGSQCPCIILSDLRMPGLNGYELVERLQANEETRKIPVIISSANFDTASTQPVMHPGVTAYLAKPFDEVKLLSCIELALHTGFNQNSR